MKKLAFMFVAVLAISFASCENATKKAEAVVEAADSTLQEAAEVVDSLVDTTAAQTAEVVDSAAAALN